MPTLDTRPKMRSAANKNHERDILFSFVENSDQHGYLKIDPIMETIEESDDVIRSPKIAQKTPNKCLLLQTRNGVQKRP